MCRLVTARVAYLFESIVSALRARRKNFALVEIDVSSAVGTAVATAILLGSAFTFHKSTLLLFDINNYCKT